MPTIATLYPVAGHPLLSDKYAGLKDDDQRHAHHVMAELLLRLLPPAYEDDEAVMLTMAVVQQINFQLQQEIEPEILKSKSNTHPGNTTAYRDRYLSPRAWAIVERVTGAEVVAFSVPGT